MRRGFSSMPADMHNLDGSGASRNRSESRTRMSLAKGLSQLFGSGDDSLFSGRRSIKQFSLTVRESTGMNAVIEELSSFDRLGALRAKVARRFNCSPGLIRLFFEEKLLTVKDMLKTLGELGIREGVELACTCRAPAEINGHFYALTESHAEADADIAAAVSAEFGNDGRVADFPALQKRCAEVDVDDFVAFLDALGNFITARIFLRKGKDKNASFIQREREGVACTDFANIHMRLTLRESAFHPMYVLVDLGNFTSTLSGTRASIGQSLLSAASFDSEFDRSFDAQASTTSKGYPPPPCLEPIPSNHSEEYLEDLDSSACKNVLDLSASASERKKSPDIAAMIRNRQTLECKLDFMMKYAELHPLSTPQKVRDIIMNKVLETTAWKKQALTNEMLDEKIAEIDEFIQSTGLIVGEDS